MNKLILTILLALAPCSIIGAAPEQLNLQISPDKPDGSYAVGETITWNVKLLGVKAGGPFPSPGYTITSGKTELASGTLVFDQAAAKVSAKADKPGIAVLKVDLKTKWGSSSCGAAVGWRDIKSSVAEPADFDAFWAAKLQELAAVPMNPVLEEVADSGSPDVRLWKITMDHIRGTRIYGYLARPRTSGPLPAQLQLQYWGVYPLNRSEVVNIARQGWIAMNIMAHDLPCDRDAAFYKNPGINTQVNSGSDDPDRSYFLRMFLSCSRAVDYLAGRPDWNKGALLVQGGSQGGFQGIATAALNRQVTALTVFVPGGGNLTGFLDGQPDGWPGWVNSKATGAAREALVRTAGYYDTNHFARRIKCPVLVGTGLLDDISKPETQFTMFNNITAPKRMVLMPADGHIGAQTAYKEARNAWWKAAAAGGPLPMQQEMIRVGNPPVTAPGP